MQFVFSACLNIRYAVHISHLNLARAYISLLEHDNAHCQLEKCYSILETTSEIGLEHIGIVHYHLLYALISFFSEDAPLYGRSPARTKRIPKSIQHSHEYIFFLQ